MHCPAGYPIASDRRDLECKNLGVSPELQSLIMSMLALDPGRRPSAEEVNQQISQLWSVDPKRTPEANCEVSMEHCSMTQEPTGEPQHRSFTYELEDWSRMSRKAGSICVTLLPATTEFDSQGAWILLSSVWPDAHLYF